MYKYFITPAHKNNYLNLIIEDDMFPEDMERASLFYILSGNEDLYRKRRFIYDPIKHCIKKCFDNKEVDFSSGMASLIRLGFNLYNNWSEGCMSPMDRFRNLDEQNRELAGNALQIRFNKDFYNKQMK